mgnify:CR=1 FL=1
MKKQSKILLLILLAVILLVGISQYQLSRQGSLTFPDSIKERLLKLDQSTPTSSVVETFVTINIDFGKGKKLEEKVEAKTVYEALKQVADLKGLQLEAKKYKYGLLVERIGNSVNSADWAWMYWVNGKAGQIASDLYQVAPQDKIEWKYEKISP